MRLTAVFTIVLTLCYLSSAAPFREVSVDIDNTKQHPGILPVTNTDSSQGPSVSNTSDSSAGSVESTNDEAAATSESRKARTTFVTLKVVMTPTVDPNASPYDQDHTDYDGHMYTSWTGSGSNKCESAWTSSGVSACTSGSSVATMPTSINYGLQFTGQPFTTSTVGSNETYTLTAFADSYAEFVVYSYLPGMSFDTAYPITISISSPTNSMNAANLQLTTLSFPAGSCQYYRYWHTYSFYFQPSLNKITATKINKVTCSPQPINAPLSGYSYPTMIRSNPDPNYADCDLC